MGEARIKANDDAGHADDAGGIAHRQERRNHRGGGLGARCLDSRIGQPPGACLFGRRTPEPDQVQPGPLQMDGHLQPLRLGPELGVSAGTGDQQCHGPPLRQPGGFVDAQVRHGQAEAGRRVDGIAEGAGTDGTVAPHHVPVTRDRHGTIVGERRQRLPGRGTVGAHAHAAPGHAHDSRALDESLAVEDPVIATAAQCLPEGLQGRPCLGLAQRLSPASPGQRDDLIDGRIHGRQGRKGRFDDPLDAGIRKLCAQVGGQGLGMDDVPHGGHLDDQDPVHRQQTAEKQATETETPHQPRDRCGVSDKNE